MMIAQSQIKPEHSNKLINNGYLRAAPTAAATQSHIIGNNSNLDINNSTGNAHTNNSNSGNTINTPNSASDKRLPIEESDTSSVMSPLLDKRNNTHSNDIKMQQQQQPLIQTPAYAAGNASHPTKMPTVVYLGNDGNIGTGLSGDNNKASSNTSGPTLTPHQHTDRLLKKLAKRRCLWLFGILLTVFGATFGALITIYLYGGYACYPNATIASSTTGTTTTTTNAVFDSISHRQQHTDVLTNSDNICLTDECVRTAAVLLSAMDTSVDPCDNFFQYACGTWNKMHMIPEDRGSISTFEVLADQLQVILKGILEDPINDMDNKATIKAKTFYKSCMDIPQIRKLGENRLKKVLKSLGGWPVTEADWQPPKMSMEELLGILRANYSEHPFVEIYVAADDKNSSVYILQVDQLQFALPSRDYYLKQSSENHLKAYHNYMTKTAILLGADPETAAKELQEVLQLEIQLVDSTLPEPDRHDTGALYKKLSIAELQAQVPQLNWTLYLQTALGSDIPLQQDEQLVTLSMSYLVDMGRIYAQADKRVVHNYVLWRLVMSIMAHLTDEYQREIVEFRKIITGIQSERNRWSQCVEWTNKRLGIAVGALFVRDNFNQESKDTALDMIHDIREAFNELLAENHWMDDETRAVAKDKADSMNERIGYPDLLTNTTELEKEYENLTIIENDFMQNILSILRWESDKSLQLLRQPVDKEKWTTEPAVVNAFYNPNKNDIVFPAGILQPIFYSKNFPKSLNYGGIGVVIGHEITHGFDDKGRQYDKEGNLMEWWNNATIKAFRQRTQCIIDQYSKYKIEELGMFMDGRMTQGENIADNGGLKQAFRAYKKWVSRHGAEPLLPGLNLTHDQLFFLNYAQIWCGSMRPEDALTKIRSSSHSPGSIRVLGPLSNSEDFSNAYQCKLGTPMNPINKCSVW